VVVGESLQVCSLGARVGAIDKTGGDERTQRSGWRFRVLIFRSAP
jgi:hypothetical protein